MTMRASASIEIDRPMEQVWQFTAVEHCANHPRWDPSVARIESLDAGPIREGYRFRMTRRTMGRVEDRDFAVVTWDPPTIFDIETSSSDMTLRLTSHSERIDASRTRFTVGGEAQLRGIRGLLMPLFRSRVERDLRANLARIKAMVEAGESISAKSGAS